jgi:hypothetical protein
VLAKERPALFSDLPESFKVGPPPMKAMAEKSSSPRPNGLRGEVFCALATGSAF